MSVEITEDEHRRLLDRDRLLACLEVAGIDNTEAYGEGMRLYLGEEEV